MLYISMRQCTIFILFLASGQVTGLSTQSLLYGHSLRKSIFSRDESTDSGDDSSGSLDEVPVASSSGMGAATRNQIIIAIVVAVISLIGSKSDKVSFIASCAPYADLLHSFSGCCNLHQEKETMGRYREQPPRASSRILCPSCLSISRTPSTPPGVAV